MPNLLRRMSGSSLSGSNKNSSSSGKDSSCSDGRNEEEEEKQRGSPCSNNGGLKAAKKLSAVKYRAILLKNQARVEEDEKSDKKKKKKLIVGLGNGLAQGVKGKVGGDGSRSMEIEHNGGQCSESKLKGVERSKEGEIKAEDTVPVEPEEDGGNLNVKVCGGAGGISENCCKDVQPRYAAEMASDDNVCVICKLGGSTGKLLGCSDKGCKKTYHLKCVDPPLKDVPPGDWYCFCCVKKNSESGVLSLLGAVKSNLDAAQLELADSENVDTAKTSLCSKNISSDSVQKLKEKPVRVVVSDSKFVEYWVPAKLSDVQLEQYCDILLSNSILLRSCSKTETVEALRDVLTSTRKCCDHPYFVNSSLQETLTNGVSEAEYLNVGIKASGKLQELDAILSETKKQGLRVLIIFQSCVASSGISLGDVLDDVVRQRCGVDSYERVDCGLINSQFTRIKQAALNKFNDKEKGRIVFLLDRRACHSSIKLSSIDIVILYDSDLNPYNDLKLLQKITIDSQHEQLKLFRLYSLCTLEEMVLIHAKQGVSIDAQNVNHSTIHQLLRWGASYLFKELREFHGSSPSSGCSFSSEHLMTELFAPLPQDAGKASTVNSSVVVKVNQTGGTYARDISLPGELEMQSGHKDPSHVFWTKLLNRKTPRWRYLPAASSPQRIRKRVQYFQGSLEKENFDTDDVMKKRRKVLTDTIAAGESGTPAVDCSQFLPAIPTGASRYRKANKISNVPAASMGESVKISVQQELEVEVRESHHRFQSVLPRPSEPPCPKPVVEGQVELVNNSASWSASQPDIQLDSQSEPPRPEPPAKDPVELASNPALRSASQPDIQLDNGHITSQQAECPTQQPVTKEHAELPSDEVIAVEAILQMPILSIDTSVGGRGTCVSDSRSMGGVPGSINHSRQNALMTSSRTSQSLLRHDPSSNEHVSINKKPNKQLDNGIHLGHNITRQAEFPTQPATTEVHSELPSYNNALQGTMLQQPVVVNRRVRGSVTRVSDFRSLVVVPDRKIHPSQIAPSTPSQTLPEEDPFEFELAILRKEREEVVKLHEELKMRMKSDYNKELQEANRKYRKLHHNNDTALAQTRKAVHANHNIFLMNALLAECFRSKML
ncbi:hypothetical protein MKW98_016649 [Papaver atlanticum]|uniref:PHD-type domain-containing protein n=1 Tax=Papaver atlanticum TaxID=357466 RepID=A0AAD4SSR9_9MAGN|nr:hypothetical protein MKW98_016649 [Papaver atlanticum]